MELFTYKERVIIEHAKLSINIIRLENAYKHLTESIEKSILYDQLAAMKVYKKCLSDRIALY